MKLLGIDIDLSSDHTAFSAENTPTAALLEKTQPAFLDWSVLPGLDQDTFEFETTRDYLVQSLWSHDKIDTALPINATRRSTITTSHSLQQAERLLTTAETTRLSIIKTYISVDAPNEKELLNAQANDLQCQALRSYLGYRPCHRGEWFS